MNGVAHFAHWMSMCNLPAHLLDEGCIDQFLRYHLPRCDCLGGALRTPTELHAALMPVLEILRAEDVIARALAPTGPIADELSRYDAHMSSARRLATGTRRGRLRIIERLLLSKFAGRPVAVSSLLPEDVRQFVVDQLQALGITSKALTIASMLRAYLRYADVDLRAGVLTIQQSKFGKTRLVQLHASAVDAQAIIGKPGSSWTSQRDHLLLHVLYSTGARVSEIIGVRLADVVLDDAACVHLHGKPASSHSGRQ